MQGSGGCPVVVRALPARCPGGPRHGGRCPGGQACVWHHVPPHQRASNAPSGAPCPAPHTGVRYRLLASVAPSYRRPEARAGVHRGRRRGDEGVLPSCCLHPAALACLLALGRAFQPLGSAPGGAREVPPGAYPSSSLQCVPDGLAYLPSLASEGPLGGAGPPIHHRPPLPLRSEALLARHATPAWFVRQSFEALFVKSPHPFVHKAPADPD
jgi:hypothetical protein